MAVFDSLLGLVVHCDLWLHR